MVGSYSTSGRRRRRRSIRRRTGVRYWRQRQKERGYWEHQDVGEYKIKTDLGEVEWGSVDRIGLAVNKDSWRALVIVEPSGSIKGWETIEWLHNWWPL
jgi:hypothetical protein